MSLSPDQKMDQLGLNKEIRIDQQSAASYARMYEVYVLARGLQPRTVYPRAPSAPGGEDHAFAESAAGRFTRPTTQ